MCADEDDAPPSQPPSQPMRAGPGCLVFIVGPSGAGKDTLIRMAAAELAGLPGVSVARRVVTRAANQHEDHGSVDEATFGEMSAAGGFCLEWAAHGLRYGIPRAVEDDVRLGTIVLCNGSRGAVAAMRRRFVRSAVVLVTAPREVLAARIEARGRDTALSSRLDRDLDNWTSDDADLIIDNSGPPEEGAGQLIRYVGGLRVAGA